MFLIRQQCYWDSITYSELLNVDYFSFVGSDGLPNASNIGSDNNVKILATPMIYFFLICFFCYCGQFRATKIVERGTVAMIYSEVESESFVIYCQGWKWEKEVLVWNVVSFPSHPSLPPFPFFIFFYLFFPPSPLCHCVLFCSGGFLPKCTWGAWGVLGFCAFLVEKKITLCIIAHFHAL